jgi:hypothetical protein
MNFGLLHLIGFHKLFRIAFYPLKRLHFLGASKAEEVNPLQLLNTRQKTQVFGLWVAVL